MNLLMGFEAEPEGGRLAEPDGGGPRGPRRGGGFSCRLVWGTGHTWITPMTPISTFGTQ